jgi:hypothetical protein
MSVAMATAVAEDFEGISPFSEVLQGDGLVLD